MQQPIMYPKGLHLMPIVNAAIVSYLSCLLLHLKTLLLELEIGTTLYGGVFSKDTKDTVLTHVYMNKDHNQ